MSVYYCVIVAESKSKHALCYLSCAFPALLHCFLYIIEYKTCPGSLLPCVLQMSEVESAEARASEYHLSWNNYEASIASFLKILSTAKEGEEDLSDVTISCSGGKQFSAHRLVLATCSSYFRQLFVGRSINASGSGCHAHPIVYIPDMTDRVMEHLLAFMYTGQYFIEDRFNN